MFDWLSGGDIPWGESGEVKVLQTSYDYTRPYRDRIGATIVVCHVLELTDGWDPESRFHFLDGASAAVAKTQELAGGRIVQVVAGNRRLPGACRGPGRRGADKRRTRQVRVRQALLRNAPRKQSLADPGVVVRGNRVFHLRCRLRR